MAIEQNNPPNNSSSGGGSGNNSNNTNDANQRRRRNKPRRDGKGSNNQTNNPTAAKSTKTKSRRSGKGKGTKDNQALSTQASHAAVDNDLNQEVDSAADEAAAKEGGIKAIGNQRIIPFMKLEKPMAILSILMVIGSIIAIAVNGLNLGLDFTGGVSADVRYEQPVEQVEVVEALADNGFNDAIVQYLGTREELLVRLPPQSDNVEGLNESLGKALDLPNNHASISNVNIIGSQVGGEVYLSSMLAILTALGMMMLYVAVRFQFKLAVGALLALVHDAVVTVGIFALFQFPFDLTVLAAILALIGYSLNDTIVVFDRIRENFRRVRDATPRQIVDLSLTETLRRTIMTVSTVLVVVLAMLFLGGDGLFWFSVAFFIGLIAGTYSSTYISSSIPLAMGLSRDDFVVKIKPEFQEEVVTFNDPKSFED